MSQTKQILNYLERGKSLTAIQALHMFGCFRLAARILELKRRGYKIASPLIHDTEKKYSKYKLIS